MWLWLVEMRSLYNNILQLQMFICLKCEIDKHVCVQPKMDDDEGWKRFCLGENLYLGSHFDQGDSDAPGLNYVKVSVVTHSSLDTVDR